MGHSSIYCFVSNISMQGGDKVVLVPLQKPQNKLTDEEWSVACAPIFGTYNDYSGIEKIEKNSNTKLIEDALGVSIEEFCDDVCTWRDDKYAPMWIKREIWDVMKDYSPKSYGRAEYFDFGSEHLLNLLGIEYVGENKNDKRYSKIYRYKDQHFKSDGKNLSCCPPTGEDIIKKNEYGTKYLSDQNKAVYKLKTMKEKCPGLNVSWLKNKEVHHLVEKLQLNTLDIFGSLLGFYYSDLSALNVAQTKEIPFEDIFDKSKYVSDESFCWNFVSRAADRLTKEDLDGWRRPITNLERAHLKALYEGDKSLIAALADLKTVFYNFSYLSKSIAPNDGYAIQDGAHVEHLYLMGKFIKVLEDKLKTLSWWDSENKKEKE